LSFKQELTGIVDVLPAAESVWVVVAAVASFLASGPPYAFDGEHQPHRKSAIVELVLLAHLAVEER